MISPERLKQIRLARGFSQDELITRMGGMITKQALSQYESGKAQPRPAVLLQLARALDVTSRTLAEQSPLQVDFVAFRRKSGMAERDAESIRSQISFSLEKRVWLEEKLRPEQKRVFPFQA